MLPLSLVSRRFVVLAAGLALLVGMWPSLSTRPASAATGDPVLINEVLSSHTGTDDAEFIELYGTPGTGLAGLSLIVVESDAGTSQGLIDRRLDFAAPSAIGGNGFFLVGNPTGLGTRFGVTPDVTIGQDYLENSAHTIALVTTSSLSGGVGTVVTGSETVRDAVGLSDGGMGDVFYFGAPAIGPDDAFLAPGGTRIVDGVDTDSVADWAMGDFNLTDPAPTPTKSTSLGNQPVLASCGPAVAVLEGSAATRTVTATDIDGRVVALAIQGISPSDPGTITLGATTPAAGTGGTATADVTVGATTPAGTYDVLIRATNEDATPQTGDCTLTVNVTEVLQVGEVQGQTLDTDNGATDTSPLVGQTIWVRGVITQRIRLSTSPTTQNYGFFLQSAEGGADGDPLTSDGIFVFHGQFATLLREGTGTYSPVVGDEVILRGPVQEDFFQTRLNNPRLVSVIRSGVDVNADVAVTEASPPDSLAEANRFWERHEGMRFHVDANAHVVAARDVFPSTIDGEVWVIRGDHPIANRLNPYTRLIYRDPHPLDDEPALFDNGNGMRIMLQSHGLKWAQSTNQAIIAPARTFDTVTSSHTGGLYFAFSKYGIEIEQQLALTEGVDPAGNAPPSAVDPAAEFATSDYNVENLYDYRDDPNDGCDFAGNPGCEGVNPPFDYVPTSEAAYQAHLEDLAAQIMGPMHAPDLLMIQEAEDQDICWVEEAELTCGATDNADGKPDTLQELALVISAADGPTYESAFDRNGADDRGIVSAFMFRTDTVELLEADAEDPVLGSMPTIDYSGPGLPYNTDVSNPKALNAELPDGVALGDACDELDNGRCVFTRDPQVGHFRIWRDGIGASVFTDLYAISNHFSSTPDSRVAQRTQQAAYNAAIVEALLGTSTDARGVIAGDFNVFPRPDDPFTPPDPRYPSDQLGPMYKAGLENLWDTLVEEVPQSAYSYSFVGMAQTLDMQWATDGQFADLVQVRAAHLNADFAADFDGDVARGASDHDPQVARWFTDATFDRLHALVDYYVATGALPADRAFLFHDRLDKAQAYAAQGKIVTAQAQLLAFGNQAHDYAPTAVADAMAKEANRLAGLL